MANTVANAQKGIPFKKMGPALISMNAKENHPAKFRTIQYESYHMIHIILYDSYNLYDKHVSES